MDGEPISETPRRPVYDWAILSQELSELSKSPYYKLFLEVAAQLGEAGLAKLQPAYFFTSDPKGLKREIDKTFEKVDEDNPLHAFRNAKLAPYEGGKKSPYVVHVLKYNLGTPDTIEHDEVYLMSGRDELRPYIEIGHRKIKLGEYDWTNIHRIDPDEPINDETNPKMIIREILDDSPVYTRGGDEFVPSILR
jgi:hypothetical protein